MEAMKWYALMGEPRSRARCLGLGLEDLKNLGCDRYARQLAVEWETER